MVLAAAASPAGKYLFGLRLRGRAVARFPVVLDRAVALIAGGERVVGYGVDVGWGAWASGPVVLVTAEAGGTDAVGTGCRRIVVASAGACLWGLLRAGRPVVVVFTAAGGTAVGDVVWLLGG